MKLFVLCAFASLARTQHLTPRWIGGGSDPSDLIQISVYPTVTNITVRCVAFPCALTPLSDRELFDGLSGSIASPSLQNFSDNVENIHFAFALERRTLYEIICLSTPLGSSNFSSTWRSQPLRLTVGDFSWSVPSYVLLGFIFAFFLLLRVFFVFRKQMCADNMLIRASDLYTYWETEGNMQQNLFASTHKELCARGLLNPPVYFSVIVYVSHRWSDKNNSDGNNEHVERICRLLQSVYQAPSRGGLEVLVHPSKKRGTSLAGWARKCRKSGKNFDDFLNEIGIFYDYSSMDQEKEPLTARSTLLKLGDMLANSVVVFVDSPDFHTRAWCVMEEQVAKQHSVAWLKAPPLHESPVLSPGGGEHKEIHHPQLLPFSLEEEGGGSHEGLLKPQAGLPFLAEQLNGGLLKATYSQDVWNVYALAMLTELRYNKSYQKLALHLIAFLCFGLFFIHLVDNELSRSHEDIKFAFNIIVVTLLFMVWLYDVTLFCASKVSRGLFSKNKITVATTRHPFWHHTFSYFFVVEFLGKRLTDPTTITEVLYCIREGALLFICICLFFQDIDSRMASCQPSLPGFALAVFLLLACVGILYHFAFRHFPDVTQAKFIVLADAGCFALGALPNLAGAYEDRSVALAASVVAIIQTTIFIWIGGQIFSPSSRVNMVHVRHPRIRKGVAFLAILTTTLLCTRLLVDVAAPSNPVALLATPVLLGLVAMLVIKFISRLCAGISAWKRFRLLRMGLQDSVQS